MKFKMPTFSKGLGLIPVALNTQQPEEQRVTSFELSFNTRQVARN